MVDKRPGSPSLLLQLVSRHVSSLEDLKSDAEHLLMGGEVWAALPFSFLHPSLTPRRLTITRIADHYDLMCSEIYGQLPALSNSIGYKLFLPFGTVGKMLNHLTHRVDMMTDILSKKDLPEIVNAINSYIPNQTSSSQNIALIVAEFIAQSSRLMLSDRATQMALMLRSNLIFGPSNIISYKDMIASPQDRVLFDALRDGVLSDRKEEISRKLHHEDRTPKSDISQLEFESLMDAINLATPVMMSTRVSNRRCYMLGSQKRRRFLGTDNLASYSRHMMSLHYWCDTLRGASSKESFMPAAVEKVKLKLSMYKSIEDQLRYGILEKDNDFIESVTELCESTIWVPFIRSLRGDMKAAERVLKSIAGDVKATREALDAAREDASGALKILGEAITPESFDEIMYGEPSVAENERFKRIKALLHPNP